LIHFQGLVWAGLLPRPLLFPKNCFYTLLEEFYFHDKSNVHIVYYREIEHAKKRYPGHRSTLSYTSPFQIFRNYFYYELDCFADVIVEVPLGENSAQIIKQTGKRPSQLIYYGHSLFVVMGFFVLVWLSPWISIAWILVNYWLH